eukprot:TRINITY_DN8558_c0_g1_i4.p2 TRINITY_DN8558_c0_g1~~TRINITY_DN8558_c0_g1_i4.p2  ORF type:complete len:281 (-),score=17.46 TRINITY_DN8558_c0_g1_i4:289-1131(-)
MLTSTLRYNMTSTRGATGISTVCGSICKNVGPSCLGCPLAPRRRMSTIFSLSTDPLTFSFYPSNKMHLLLCLRATLHMSLSPHLRKPTAQSALVTLDSPPLVVSLCNTEQHPALDPIDSESQDHPAWTAATRRLRSGARTPEEAAQFCRQELASREIAQVSAIPVSVFERLCNVLTQTKGVLPGCVPPTLLYAQFHTHARGQAQTVPISVALDLLAPLQQQFSPLLPNAAEWLRGRFTKFCPEGTTQVDKSTFVALRNNIAWAYQATQYLEELLSPETMP